jgi:hypothetical protein
VRDAGGELLRRRGELPNGTTAGDVLAAVARRACGLGVPPAALGALARDHGDQAVLAAVVAAAAEPNLRDLLGLVVAKLAGSRGRGGYAPRVIFLPASAEPDPEPEPDEPPAAPAEPEPEAPPSTAAERRVWERVLGRLRQGADKSTYQTWIQNTGLAGLTADSATVTVPSAFVREWLEGRYAGRIGAALEAELGHPVALVFALRRRRPRQTEV